MNNKLIVFARLPKQGKVKTRLAAKMGATKALAIYKNLLESTLAVAFKSNAHVKTYWSAQGHNTIHHQTGKDLGGRMYNCLTEEINPDTYICLVGTDTPQLSTLIIDKAFTILKDKDVVLGPAQDGGYYLIGFKKDIPQELFLDKKWSHPKVLEDAINTCTQTLGLSVGLLPTLMDIDTAEDYAQWKTST